MAMGAELRPAGATPLHVALTLLLMLVTADAITSPQQKQLLVWQSSDLQTSREGSCAQVGSAAASGAEARLRV
jgi:hypothetical protein